MNEDERAEYEEKIQARIGEVWSKVEAKQEVLQKNYQDQLENIIDEVAQTKYEKLHELKMDYKNMAQDDEEMKQEMESKKAALLQEMEELKQTKIKEAKDELEAKKKEI